MTVIILAGFAERRPPQSLLEDRLYVNFPSRNDDTPREADQTI
jgi:hypothetical protein